MTRDDQQPEETTIEAQASAGGASVETADGTSTTIERAAADQTANSAPALEARGPHGEEEVAARVAEREANLACMDRLAAAIRELDAAASLSDVLTSMTSHARTLLDGRVVTLIVGPNDLKVWQAHGFEGAAETGATFELAPDAACVAAVAARTGQVRNTREKDNGRSLEGLRCAPLPDDRVGLAVPLLVGKEAVAVLYADDVVEERQPTVPSTWPDALEILARHASARLERLTVDRAYGLHLGSKSGRGSEAASPGTAAGRDGAADPTGDEGADSEDESAQRYARLLVSEIRLYHEDAVNEAQREGNLLAKLGPEISRSRRLYEQRVPVQVRARSDYFRQELVRTLANGDERLLGQDT